MKYASWFIVAFGVLLLAVLALSLLSCKEDPQEASMFYVGKVVQVAQGEGEFATVETDSGYFDVKKPIDLPRGSETFLSVRKMAKDEYHWVLLVDGKEIEVY